MITYYIQTCTMYEYV